MMKDGPWWKPNNFASIAWLGLFLPALACYLHFLSRHLNTYPHVEGSSIERLSAELDGIVPVGAKVEMIADGFSFTEGPLWVHDEEADRQYLLFSDVPKNRIWKWEEGGGMFTLGKSLFLDRSGCRGGEYCQTLREPGSNGLTLVPGSGEVVICEHGNRRVTRMERNGTRTALATHYKGRQLNSPNDVVFSNRGDLYFTDPPFGLPQKNKTPEYSGFSGLYRIKKEILETVRADDEAVPDPELLEKDFTWPNGLAFSPDFSKLYLADSSPENPAWYIYDVTENGGLSKRRKFLDGKPMTKEGRVGAPDGVKVDEMGNIFATCAGGVAVVSPEGEVLGMILSGGTVVANVGFGGDGYLYMTASETIMRIKLLTKGASVPPAR